MTYEITDSTELYEILHERLPFKIEDQIDGITLQIELLYNEPNDIYTAQFYDGQGLFLGAAKLTYGENILKTISPQLNLKTRIVPLDINRETGGQTSGNPRVGIENFGKTVFMVVFRE